MKTNQDKWQTEPLLVKQLSWAFIAIGIIALLYGVITKHTLEGPAVALPDFLLLLGLGMSARWNFACAVGLLVMAITTTVTVYVLAPDYFFPHRACQRYWGAAGMNIGYMTIATGVIFISIHVAKHFGIDPD